MTIFLSVPLSKLNYQGLSSKIWFTASLLRIKKLKKLCYQYTICTQNKPLRKSMIWPAEGGWCPQNPHNAVTMHSQPKGDCIGCYRKTASEKVQCPWRWWPQFPNHASGGKCLLLPSLWLKFNSRVTVPFQPPATRLVGGCGTEDIGSLDQTRKSQHSACPPHLP